MELSGNTELSLSIQSTNMNENICYFYKNILFSIFRVPLIILGGVTIGRE